jgi:hypothetical protein
MELVEVSVQVQVGVNPGFQVGGVVVDRQVGQMYADERQPERVGAVMLEVRDSRSYPGFQTPTPLLL